MKTFTPRHPQPIRRDLTDPRSSGAPQPHGQGPALGLNDPRSARADRRGG